MSDENDTSPDEDSPGSNDQTEYELTDEEMAAYEQGQKELNEELGDHSANWEAEQPEEDVVQQDDRDYTQALENTNPHHTLDYTPGGELERSVHEQERSYIEEGYKSQQEEASKIEDLKAEWDNIAHDTDYSPDVDMGPDLGDDD